MSTQITITALAFVDVTGRGLQVSHMVGIFDAGTSALLVSANVPAGQSATFRDGFRVVPVNYVLNPGTYVIAGLSPSNIDPVIVRSSSINTVPQVTYLEERELESTTFTMPTVNLPQNEKGNFGPTFLISDISQPNSISGVTNSASAGAGAAASTYVSLFGTGLANTSRAWSQSDFVGGTGLPVSLDGVSVTVGGTPAYVEYVSPGQINFITPDIGTSTGAVPVVVKSTGKPDLTVWIDIRTVAPALFAWLTGTAESGRYFVAQHADYTNVGKQGLFPDKSVNFTTPARPGETIILYGTGFGTTTPHFAGSQITDKVYPLSPLPTVTIGGVNATVVFAGLIPPLAAVYQFNVVVPSGLPNGDQPLVITTNGVNSSSGLITIQN